MCSADTEWTYYHYLTRFTRVLYTLCLGTVSVHAWVRPSYGLWGFARLQYTDY